MALLIKSDWSMAINLSQDGRFTSVVYEQMGAGKRIVFSQLLTSKSSRSLTSRGEKHLASGWDGPLEIEQSTADKFYIKIKTGYYGQNVT